MIDLYEMLGRSPVENRRGTELIERDALRIRGVRERLVADLAEIDRASSVVMQDRNPQQNAGE